MYDPLNRLTQASGPGGTLVIGYDAIGNITSRSDVSGGASWSYHATKKHAVTAAGGVAYGYDDNGNMTSRAGSTITWTTGQQPVQINGGGYTAAFDYAPDRARWRQVSSYAGTSETTIYVGGLMEKLTTPSKTEYKHLIPTPSGFVQAIRRVGGYTATHYLAGDHLGSVDAVLNSSGGVMVRTSFSAFGARRDDDWNGLPSAAELTQIAGTSRRGFTGHEMLDNLGLIHMNGRVYDPALGRFMSADPFIDQGLGPQGFNRYAYVGNNPLSATDPSGYSSNRGPQIYSLLNGPDQPPPSAFEVHIALYPAGPLQPPLLFNSSLIFWGSNHTPSARPRPPAMRDPGPPAPGSCVSEMCDDSNVGKVGGTSLGRMLTELAVPGAAYFNMGHEAEGQRRYLAAFGWYTAGYVEAIGTIATAGVGGLVAWPTRATTVAARGGLVIDRGADLAKPGALRAGEYALKWDSKLPNFKAEWAENAGRLREVMRQGNPIRDASVGNTGGIFLNAERALLKDRVRYRKGEIEARLYHGRRSFEVGFEIARDGECYSISELIRAADRVEGEQYRNWTATTQQGIAEALGRLKELVSRYGERALRGDPGLFETLTKLRLEWMENYSLDVLASQLRPKTDAAFRSGDYREAAALYEKIQPRLSPSELKKLALAKERAES